ncbi:Flagellar hook-length control protein FliK [Cystobacter fuscus DSM 2262]|uniref:Flagellar hook-length control protein FliK n=2 Tax=Cystobacter fuscus TaxID=43 RepID=S9PQ06_CYSF2|nr:Flagellar hook-length control protein FliK [Cystobacter fuscus DSM 2262]
MGAAQELGARRGRVMMKERGGRRLIKLSLLAGLLAACHETGETRAVQATAAVDTNALDFGEVPVGEWREKVVRLRNVGYVPFRALEALELGDNPSYEVSFDGDSRLMPGEEKLVKVRFHPLAEGGSESSLQVRTDASSGKEHTVRVLGQGGPLTVRMEPEVLDFETLEVDSERVLRLTITNPVDLPLSVEVKGEAAAAFSAENITVPPLATYQLETKYFPRDLGQMKAQVEVRPCATCTPTVAGLTGRSVASAFEFDPAPVPFDSIPVHETTRSFTRARNITWRPVTIQALNTSDPAFTPLNAMTSTEVKPGEVVQLPMQFAARFSGPNTGKLTVGYQSDKPRTTEVALDARGGRPTLAVAPLALDFGELPAGGKVGKTIRITNAGTTGNLYFRGVKATGNVEHFSVDVIQRGKAPQPWKPGSAWPALETDNLPIAPGTDALDLTVYYEPKASGAWQATLVLVSDDLFNPERTILLTGSARETGACVFTLKPQPEMDFGNLEPGRGAVLGFRFDNAGRAECAVKDIHISNDAGGAFTMPGGKIVGGVVPFDTAFSAMVSFRPPAAGDYVGELKLTVNDPANPTVTLPLRGTSRGSCLVAAPAFVDFGPIRYDCATTPRRTLVSNQCATPVAVTETRIGAGTSDQYQLVSPISLPRTLAPGEGFELEFSYARNVLGQHYSPFFVKEQAEPSPLMIPLLAETNHEGLQLDRFIQGTDSQLDVLFVVSNTTTMQDFQARLKAAMPGWLERARQAGVDVRIGVTSTGLSTRSPACANATAGGDAGRLVPADGSRPRTLSSSSATAAQGVQANIDSLGLCHNLVQGLETMRQGLSSPLATSADDPRTPLPNDGNLGFLRATARLAVVVVSDEDDHSGFEPESYVQFLQSLKGTGMAHRSQMYALVPTDARCTTAGAPGTRFSTVAQRTGGAVDSICQSDYGPFLDNLLKRAGGPQADFPLTATPNGLAEMSVRVGGTTVGVDKWTYDTQHNTVVFKNGAVPVTGQTIEVRYRSVCAAP